MSLKDKGSRFFISPCRLNGRWLRPVVHAELYSDWIDVTDWDDEKLAQYLNWP